MSDEHFLASSCNNEHLLVPLNGNLAMGYEVHDFVNELGRLVLLDNMTAVSNDIHLILTLHVSHGQLSIHSLSSRKEEHLLG